MQTIDVGETWPIETAWWNADRAATEPTAITLTIDPPSGAQLVKDKTDMTSLDAPTDSRWSYPLVVTEAGVWRVHALGTVDTLPVAQSFLFLAGEASLTDGPCAPWITWDDVEGVCPTPDLSALSAGTRDYLLDVATWVLYSFSNRRYGGICDTTRRVCRSCVTCGGACACGIRSTLDLSGGRYPVHGAWDVIIDGTTLPASAYRVRGRRWLDRIDGSSWPAWSDLSDPDAFSVSYAFGRQPPIGMRHAASRFVAEMAKKCLGLKCQIPERVTSINREGVSYTIIDSQRFLDEGRTGIGDVDLMLAAENRGRTQSARPGGYSPMTG